MGVMYYLAARNDDAKIVLLYPIGKNLESMDPHQFTEAYQKVENAIDRYMERLETMYYEEEDEHVARIKVKQDENGELVIDVLTPDDAPSHLAREVLSTLEGAFPFHYLSRSFVAFAWAFMFKKPEIISESEKDELQEKGYRIINLDMLEFPYKTTENPDTHKVTIFNKGLSMVVVNGRVKHKFTNIFDVIDALAEGGVIPDGFTNIAYDTAEGLKTAFTAPVLAGRYLGTLTVRMEGDTLYISLSHHFRSQNWEKVSKRQEKVEGEFVKILEQIREIAES